jgi:hypothetical protein
MLAEQGIESVKLPPRSPNLNAYAERFVRTIKEDCLEKMILFGEDALRRAVHEFVAHYHFERNHQGLRNRLIIAPKTVQMLGRVRRKQRLGGLLNYYHRVVAWRLVEGTLPKTRSATHRALRVRQHVQFVRLTLIHSAIVSKDV